MTAPTEAEIREAIEHEFRDWQFDRDDFAGAYREIGVVMDSDLARSREPSGWMSDVSWQGWDHPGTLWADLNEAETEELQESLHQALRDVTDRAKVDLIESLIAATVAFAQSHPDAGRGRYAPRAARESVTA